MASLDIKPLAEGIGFGARIAGIDRTALQDADVRARLNALYEEKGVLVFEEMERTGRMLSDLAGVFGPLRDHAMNNVTEADEESGAAVLELKNGPQDGDIFEVDGQQLSGWLPWHYDACYARELYRGALLRAIAIPPEGGLTGFADGIQLYRAISPDLREVCEKLEIVYHAGLMFMKQRFGMPASYRVVRMQQASLDVLEAHRDAPRAIQPAVWRRRTGEKVLHISPWQAAGIAGREDPEGDALLEAICQEIYAAMQPYWHAWQPGDMVLWDNWRFLHGVSGHDPRYTRHVHRVAIEGDYGLGRWETVPGEKAGVTADF